MSELPPCPDVALMRDLSETRRRFHRTPELSWTEYQTTARLCEELESLGFAVEWGQRLYARAPGNPPDPETDARAWQRAEQALGADNRYLAAMQSNRTGLVATLDGSGPGRVFGFRFDIDALPISESDAAAHVPAAEGFASAYPGIMHACGHDGHLTIGLGLARRLAASRGRWNGRVHLFFQPAEEVAGGGAVFAELPQLAEVQLFTTLHLGILDRYRIVFDATWIAARIYDVVYRGLASHAGNAPQAGRNALLAACQAVQGLYALPRHSAGMSRVNVGRFRSDNAHNVIADEVHFRYEVRGGDDAICDFMAEAAERVLEGAARMNGVEWQRSVFAEFSSCPNSRALAERIAGLAQGLGLPQALLQDSFQVSASEDAGYLIRRVREQGGEATHLILGSPVGGGHHSPTFDFDEQLLGWGVLLFERLVTEG
ncbi:peptidase M20 [Marinobacterium nitratireducens]|uniref:Peptidase M20 n=1 Tax=Marinobacterium nitratireducens TaxID=518897 RepID=A0A918DUX7_9GAMM|nr:amidohydrolase [Marinobacterium nitratireducens]GGO83009.1 peptidase M20 [Marinobacterium nitratireducens]